MEQVHLKKIYLTPRRKQIMNIIKIRVQSKMEYTPTTLVLE